MYFTLNQSRNSAMGDPLNMFSDDDRVSVISAPCDLPLQMKDKPKGGAMVDYLKAELDHVRSQKADIEKELLTKAREVEQMKADHHN